jgi:hypothetical protein
MSHLTIGLRPIRESIRRLSRQRLERYDSGPFGRIQVNAMRWAEAD